MPICEWTQRVRKLWAWGIDGSGGTSPGQRLIPYQTEPLTAANCLLRDNHHLVERGIECSVTHTMRHSWRTLARFLSSAISDTAISGLVTDERGESVMRSHWRLRSARTALTGQLDTSIHTSQHLMHQPALWLQVIIYDGFYNYLIHEKPETDVFSQVLPAQEFAT